MICVGQVKPSWFAAAVVCVALAMPCAAQQVPTLTFHTIARYGSADSNGTASADDAATLGNISGMAEGRDGAIYVADPTAHHIVVFDGSGAVRRTIGRSGEGPGEFRGPTRVAASVDGSIYVWDAGLRRLTHFAADGGLLSQVALAAPQVTDMTIAAGRAWFVQLRFTRGDAIKAFDATTGATVDSFAPLTPPELAMDRAGNPGAITHDGAGDIVYAGPIPIMLHIWSHGAEHDEGTPLRADIATVTMNQDHVATARGSVRSIAPLSDGSYAVVYGVADSTDATTGVPVETYWLGRLDSDGRLVGRAALPPGSSAPRLAPTANGDLLLSVSVDAPQVWRIRLGDH